MAWSGEHQEGECLPHRAASWSDKGEARRFSRIAGVGYGLFYGLAFGLAVWGYDAWALARIHAELAWVKLGLGLPVLLLLGAAAGYLAGRNGRGGVWVAAWTLYGVMMGIVAGGIPFSGYNLVTWILEPRLWGVNAYPMGRAVTARMIFAATVTGCAGTVGGAIGCALTGKAQALISAAGRVSIQSWTVLFVGMPIALLPGMACDKLINGGLRRAQEVVHAAISGNREEDTIDTNIVLPGDQFSNVYTLHLADYDLEGERHTVDVVYGVHGNELTVRCTLIDTVLAGCSPISPRFETWIDALILDGLKGGRGTELTSLADHVSLNADTPAWLASQEGLISDDYNIFKDTQRGQWVIMSAHFDTHYVLRCYFRGAAPVVLTHCEFQR